MKGLEKTIIESIDQSNLKMTDLGFSVSQMVRSEILSDDNDGGEFEQPDVDDDETYLESALQMNRKRKTGQRGRPKDIDYGFVRSTTHKMAPEAAKLMGAANQAFVGRQLDQAQELLLQVIKLAPTSHEAYSTLGLVHEEQGERDKASGCYMLAAMMNPGDTELWLKLAEWAEFDGTNREGKRKEAVFCYSKAISALLAKKNEHTKEKSNEGVVDEFLQELFHRRAHLYLELQQPIDAVKSFFRLLVFKLNDSDLLGKVVRLAISHSIPLIAADVIERAARQSAQLTNWSTINTILELIFMSEPTDHERVDKICKEFGMQLVDQSLLLSNPEWGSWSDEEKENVILSNMPFGIYLRFSIANVKLGRSSLVNMNLILSRRLEDGKLANLYYILVDAFYSCSLYEQAVAILHVLLNNSETWSVKGCCLAGHCFHKLSKLREAEEAFKVCLATDPGHEEARIALATVYKELGDERRVVETLESGRRFKLLKKKAKVVDADLDKDDEIWRQDSASSSGSSTDLDELELYEEEEEESSLFVSPKNAKRVSRSGVSRLKTSTTSSSSSSRIDYSEDDCNQVRQEYQRISLALQVRIGGGRELYSDAVLAAHQLIQDGLLCNPNIMVKVNKQARWLLSADWSTERAILKGLLLSEWTLLIVKYCSAISEHFKQSSQACSMLLKLHQGSMLFKLCDMMNEYKLRVTLAEVALLSCNYPALLLAVRPMIKAGHNNAFSRWFWGHLIKMGNRGRDCLLSSIPFARFINRHVQLLADGPERDAVLCLQGHVYSMSGSWEEALRAYLLISQEGDTKKQLLFNVYYHRAQQRTCFTQKWFFLKALACLESMDPSAIKDYNKARCFHGLGILDGASRHYLAVLHSATAEEQVKRAAAYNLHLLCNHERGDVKSIVKQFM